MTKKVFKLVYRFLRIRHKKWSYEKMLFGCGSIHYSQYKFMLAAISGYIVLPEDLQAPNIDLELLRTTIFEFKLSQNDISF